MKTITITLPSRENEAYNVYIGTDVLIKLGTFIDLKKYTNFAIVTDEHVAPKWLATIMSGLPKQAVVITVQAGDKNKTIDAVQTIWQELSNNTFDRKSLVINLGGGMIGDLGGFAASTYMRGIDFLQVPTTLLSQVDASVGGKVGINFNNSKNLIGSFNQPIGVVIDTKTVATLPEREYLSGFGEILKHGLIANKVHFEIMSKMNPKEISPEALVDIIETNVTIKAAIIMRDEKEDGERKKLNFGHTIGHALESLSHTTKKPLLHGEAVSVGMVGEAFIAANLGMISESDYNHILKTLKAYNLPTTYPFGDNRPIIEKIYTDKKNESGVIKWTLLNGIGNAIYDQIVDKELILGAIATVTKKE